MNRREELDERIKILEKAQEGGDGSRVTELRIMSFKVRREAWEDK